MVRAGQTDVRGGDPGAAGGDRPANAAGIEPLFELDPAGGQVVVTRFDCRTLVKLALIVALHMRMKGHVRRQARGFIGGRAIIDWRRRSLLSISLWRDIDSVYSMGGVPQHIVAARLPTRLGIATTCGVYCFAGDWRRVMFRTNSKARSPLNAD